jgi:serine/threonine-protein kinase RsbW
MQKKFKRDLGSLESIFTFIHEFVSRNGLNDSLNYLLNLAIEELFTNMIKYNKQNSNPILIRLTKQENRLVISMTEFDTEPFNIKEVKSYDRNQKLQQRPVGGLGIHLVKNMMDQIDYKYDNRKSTIILIKRLRKTYV